MTQTCSSGMNGLDQRTTKLSIKLAMGPEGPRWVSLADVSCAGLGQAGCDVCNVL